MRLLWIRAVTIIQLVLLLPFLSGDAFPIEETADGTELYTEVMTVTVLDTDKEGSLLESSMEHIQSPDAGQSEAESEHHNVPTSNTTHTSASTKIPTYSVSTPETIIHHGVTPSNTVLDTVSTMGPTSTIASSPKSLHQSVTPNNTQPSSASVMTTSHSNSTSSEMEHQSATPNNPLQRTIHTMAPTQPSATSSSKTMEPSLADVTELYTEIITVLIIDKEGSLPNNSLGRMESADAMQRSPSTREAVHHSVTPSDTMPDTVSTVQPARTIARSSETAHQRMTPNTNQHSTASTFTNASTSEMIHSSVTPSDLAPPISRHPDTSNTPDAFLGALHNTRAPAHNTGFSDDINVTDTEVTPNNAADTGDALQNIPNVSGVEHIESDNDHRSNNTVSADSTSRVSDLSQVPSSSIEESLFTETYTQIIEIEEMEEIDDGNLGNGNVSGRNDADLIHSDSTPRAPGPGVKSTHSATQHIANNTLSSRDKTDHTASYTDFTQANTDTLSVNTQFTPHKESAQENTYRSPNTSRSTPNTSNPNTKSSIRDGLSSSFDTLFTETYTEVIEIMEMEENDGNS